MDSLFAAGRDAHPKIDLDRAAFFERVSTLTIQAGKSIEAADFYLATACELGCEGAWDRFNELYADPVRAIALRWGASSADAEEIAGALPGELLQPSANGRHRTLIGSYDGSGTLHGWLTRVVDRRLVDRVRKRSPDALPEFDARASSGCAPSDQVIHAETGDRVAAAFQKSLLALSPRDFELLRLKYRDGVSQAEIASKLEVTPARISYLVKRVVGQLRISVLQEIPDETAGTWLSRDGLASVLNDAIHRVLQK